MFGAMETKRELLYVDDLAEACEFFLKKPVRHSLINIGSGQEKTIKEYCNFLIKKFRIKLNIKFDKKKPNGTPRKILDTNLAKRYGWKSKINLETGFKLTFNDFKKNKLKDI